MGLLVRQGEGKGPRAGAEAGRGRGTAAGIYEIRRLRRGRCGGLWGRPSSRPAVARYPAPALPLCRAALPGDSFPARVFDKSALVSAPHPVFCARFGRKCARSGLRPRVSRTIQAKMRASGLVLRRVGSVCAGFAPGGAFLERIGRVFAKNAPGKGAEPPQKGFGCGLAPRKKSGLAPSKKKHLSPPVKQEAGPQRVGLFQILLIAYYSATTSTLTVAKTPL